MNDHPIFADALINLALTPEQKLHLCREMQRIRCFEQTALQKYQSVHMAGFLLLQIGQESISVGVRSLMGPQDHSICGMRGIGHALAAGLSMRAIMAELYGKATGVSRGKAGMNGFHCTEQRHWGNYAIAGTQTALAAGLAFGLKYRGERGAVCCFLGDGAMNQGVVHEAMNLAGLMSLPVVFIIENNGYAMGTSVARSSALKGPLASRAAGYGIEWDCINGDSLYEIRAKTLPALERARHEQRPTVLEIATYRFMGFTVADANALKYRSKAEVSDRQENHDPLELWQQQLLAEGITDMPGLHRMECEAEREANASTTFARQSPFPPPEAIYEDIYTTIDQQPEKRFCSIKKQWVADRPRGRHFFE
jgi:pyruvate dehydrogenase E1 component alpha subunit